MEFVSVHTADDAAPHVATLLISRPPTNALTRQLCRELATASAQLAERTDVTAVILFGGHEIFCTGADLPEWRTLQGEEVGRAAEALRVATDAVARIPKPTVAAVTGYALGAGLTLALAADWRVSGDNAKFGATEVLDGLPIPAGASARLAEAVGQGRARDLAFTGRFAGPEEALAIGLVDDLAPPDHVYDAARAWAGRFADASVDDLARAKTSFTPVSGPRAGSARGPAR
jgi:enoyl-CoA hydratase